ncbi:acyl-CoA carboxylase subunit epsilon [Nocardioides sp. TRM66260-LWL]|uniref:acyl-CoA carboxylase subunit epsilon n=1 Tax=Nocardioides sp. TRM66260-LWL TaxID=2874478 RepID=UPI001CC4EF1A|nr:acyl-CoA carboxylase subunit epsilon [Nocardioides sp. TRM66260-LWL]MBZ5733292.1 acyl-CoA carboxylase subunit epsilon [Nocardioides sp. TRM66260-LWL]
MSGEEQAPAEAAEAAAPAAPLLRVVNPDATPEEIAAIVAVLSALGSGAAPAPAPRSQWAAPARRLRGAHGSGPGAWRASGLPR